VVVLNRTPAAAAELAEGFDAEHGGLDQLLPRLTEADVTVTSTGAETPIITASMVRRAVEADPDRRRMILDIAVPRDVEPAAAEVTGVTLYNLDDLDRAVAAHMGRRSEQRNRCEAILDQCVQQFADWLVARQVTPTIEALARRIETIAAEELRSARNKFSTHDDAEEDQQVLERAVHRVVRRILHTPTEALKAEATGEAAQLHAAVLRRLFDLGEDGA
jgi:glutamyl-tRNA reductase